MILSPDRVNFDRITELVYVGSRLATLDDYHRVRAQGVRACVDMKMEGCDTWPFDAFLWLPTPDHEAPTIQHLHLGMAFLRQCEQQKMACFVGCLAGVGRSSTLVLAHLLSTAFAEKGVEEALAFLCARRSCANPNRPQVASAVEAARSFRS